MGWILIGQAKINLLIKSMDFIYELFVLEEFRGKGISKMLMRTAIDYLKQDGYSEVVKCICRKSSN